MNTMTCEELGGPCDLAHDGDTADQVIKAQDKHLYEVVAAGDQAHEPALSEMKNRWKAPGPGNGLVPKGQARFRRSSRKRHPFRDYWS